MYVYHPRGSFWVGVFSSNIGTLCYELSWQHADPPPLYDLDGDLYFYQACPCLYLSAFYATFA